MYVFRGVVKVKKSKNPRKTRKWVGGSSPNSKLVGFFGNFVFFVLFFFVVHVSKKKLKLNMGVAGWGLANPSFSRIFRLFLT